MMRNCMLFIAIMCVSLPTLARPPVDSKGDVSVEPSPRQVTASVSNPQNETITCFGKLYAKTSEGKTETAVLRSCEGETCVDKIKLEPTGEHYLYLTAKGRHSAHFIKVWHNIVCVLEKKEK